MSIKKKLITLSIILGILVPQLSLAANSLDNFNVKKYLTIEGQNTTYLVGANSEQSGTVIFIINLIDLLTKLIGGVAMIIMIISGIMLITATGNEQMLEKGKNGLKYGIIGLVIALSSFLIITFINNLLSVE